jgi:plastocyanin
MTNTKWILLGIAVLVLIGIVGYFMESTPTEEYLESIPLDTQAEEQAMYQDQQTASNSAATPVPTPMVKEFTLTASNYKFEPKTIEVQKGDQVKIKVNNKGGVHTFVIPTFNVKAQTPVGKVTEVTFTADKVGTFEYLCDVGNHAKMGMKGTIVVK